MDTIFTHRSIRKYKTTPVSEEVVSKILSAASRASTVGNMQLYSIIVTSSQELRDQLSPCHFNQPMVKQAPLHITICADIHRFSKWCELRGAKPVYDNFGWFVNAMIDALLAAQNLTLQAEKEGLGVCYLGTTIYTAKKISEILKLPKGVIPLTVIVAGYPDENPPLTDRLPVRGIAHYETYNDYTPEDIDSVWHEREVSEETENLKKINDLPNLARIFTEKRYKGEDNIAISKSYFELLKEQGFFNQ